MSLLFCLFKDTTVEFCTAAYWFMITLVKVDESRLLRFAYHMVL